MCVCDLIHDAINTALESEISVYDKMKIKKLEESTDQNQWNFCMNFLRSKFRNEIHRSLRRTDERARSAGHTAASRVTHSN